METDTKRNASDSFRNNRCKVHHQQAERVYPRIFATLFTSFRPDHQPLGLPGSGVRYVRPLSRKKHISLRQKSRCYTMLFTNKIR